MAKYMYKVDEWVGNNVEIIDYDPGMDLDAFDPKGWQDEFALELETKGFTEVFAKYFGHPYGDVIGFMEDQREQDSKEEKEHKMTNYEYFKDRFVKILNEQDYDAMRDEMIRNHINFAWWTKDDFCVDPFSLIGWLYSKAEEPTVHWEDVPVDTPVYAKYGVNGVWQKRVFKSYDKEVQKVMVFPGGRNSFTSNYEEGVYCAKLAREEDIAKYVY